MSNDTPTSPASTRWRDALLAPEATLRDAIANLDASGLQIVLVALPDDTLVGTLTDGDVRRGLLRGLDLGSPVESIVHREPFVAPPSLDRDALLQLMQANHIHQLPIVDEARRVVGLQILDELLKPAYRPNLMVIMAGGKGTRLRPRTENCPKPLLPIAGKPILEHIIERAKADGFRRFALAVNYLGNMIEEYFGDGRSRGVEIDYLRETEPLGTAGAIGLLDPAPREAFVVSNGDVLTDIRYGDLLDFHSRHEAAATMAVRLHEWQHPFGVVHTQNLDITGFEEKPVARSHINAGIYALGPVALELLRGGRHCDMPTLFNALRERGQRTIAFPIHEPWLDVGRPTDFEHADGLGKAPATHKIHED